MTKDRKKLARALVKLTHAAKLCREAAVLTIAGDPSAPAAHIGFQDDLCGAARACERAASFVHSRSRE